MKQVQMENIMIKHDLLLTNHAVVIVNHVLSWYRCNDKFKKKLRHIFHLQ